MSYTQLLQVMAASCLMTVAFMLVLRSFRQRLNRWFQRYLPPRYLQPRGVRRRTPVVPAVRNADEQS